MFRRCFVLVLTTLSFNVGTAPADSLTDTAWAWNAAGASSAVWAWVSVPPCECDSTRSDCPCATPKARYDRLRDQAIAGKKPLIVFVGCGTRQIDGSLTCRWDEFPNVSKAALVVGVPVGKDLKRATVLAADCSDTMIRAAIAVGTACPDGKCRVR